MNSMNFILEALNKKASTKEETEQPNVSKLLENQKKLIERIILLTNMCLDTNENINEWSKTLEAYYEDLEAYLECE